MALIETLVVTVGAAMAKSLLGIWLKESPLAEAAGSSILDLIAKRTPDLISARKGAREFEALGDKIAESLEPVFRTYALDDNSYEVAAKEVTSAVSAANISSELLAELSYDPTRLLEYITGCYPKGGELLSEAEESLYNRALDLAAQYIIDLASNLPGYTKQNFTQILQLLHTSMQTLDSILADLEELRLASESAGRDRQFADFERDYRALIVRKFDRVNLFGADLSRRTKRYQLSVAYVALEVVSPYLYDETERTSVEAALSESFRTAVIGEAGTGKTTLVVDPKNWTRFRRFLMKSWVMELSTAYPPVLELDWRKVA